MSSELLKNEIIDKLCYTELVYGRINKKLNMELSKSEIEEFVLKILNGIDDSSITKIGKNYYISNLENTIKLTINSYTFRIITADKV